MSHDAAIKFFRERGFVANRRHWSLGDTVVVGVGPASIEAGIQVLEHVVHLVPTDNGRWDVVQLVRMHERRIPYESLEQACASVEAILRGLSPLAETCAKCGAEARVTFGDGVFSGELQWHLSTRCPHCGDATEADGSGSLPPDFRVRELLRDGSWGLLVHDVEPAKFMRAVRRALGVDLPTAKFLRDSLPGPILVGTIAEAVLAKGNMEEDDFEVEVIAMPSKGRGEQGAAADLALPPFGRSGPGS